VAALQRVFYVENNVGRRFCTAFNQFSHNHDWGAQFQNDIHPGMQRPQHGDEWWIEEIAKMGYALLTCDMAIVSGEAEREAVRASGLRFVGFANGEYDGWTQLTAIGRHWDALKEELVVPGPVTIKVYVGGTPPVVERL